MVSPDSSFYSEGPLRARRVEDLFGVIASRYDLINDLQSFGLHRVWKRRVVRLAQVSAGQRALDVCCGTGDIAFALARAGAEVTGFDFSEAMLSVARERQKRTAPVAADVSRLHIKVQDEGNKSGTISRSPAANPTFQQGDAQQLPFADNTFDAVTVGYGLRNLPDWKRGLNEMHRVAKPGARMVVLDFGKPDNGAWRALYFSYLRWFVPAFGKLFCGDSSTHAYILESLLPYPAQRGAADQMRHLGCRDVRIVNLVGGAMSINFGIK